MYTRLFISLMDTIEDIIYRALDKGIMEELMIEVGDRISEDPNRDLYTVYSQSYDDLIKITNQD
jgi:hypothetical protein